MSAPNAKLLGKKVTFWDVTADAVAVRHRTDLKQSGTVAMGRALYAGDVVFDCFRLSPKAANECVATRSINRDFVRGEQVILVGPVPVSFGGAINGSISGGITACSRMSPFSLNGSAQATDEVFGGFTASGAVIGRGWAAIGIKRH